MALETGVPLGVNYGLMKSAEENVIKAAQQAGPETGPTKVTRHDLNTHVMDQACVRKKLREFYGYEPDEDENKWKPITSDQGRELIKSCPEIKPTPKTQEAAGPSH